LHDHAAAATNNLIGEKQPFFERSVSYDELTIDSVHKLAEKSTHFGMESLLAINKDAMEFEKNDAAQSESRYRMTFGIYFYSEQAELEDLPKTDNNFSHR